LVGYIIIGAMTLMPASSPADNDALGPTSQTHVRTAFDLTVRASYEVAFPLFGSNGHGPATIGIRNLSILRRLQTFPERSSPSNTARIKLFG
jgi:hypothetical protein